MATSNRIFVANSPSHEVIQQEAAELKQLAEYDLSVNAEIASLNQKLDSAKQEARIWRERYEALVEQTKDFMAALKRAPERVKEFIQRVLRAEPERKESPREVTQTIKRQHDQSAR